MTIRACRECSRDVSTEAYSCPNCGVRNPINKSAELLKAGTDLHFTFGSLIFCNIIGNLLLNWLESGFFYWLLMIIVFFITIVLSVSIFEDSNKYKTLAATEGHKHTLATIYKTIVVIYLLLGVGNAAYVLLH
jgi:hypothetical protein